MQQNAAMRKRIEAKIFVWLVVPVAFITFINSIDRVNISYAGYSLSAELGLAPDQFGLGISMFFLAYLIFQYPHARLLHRAGIRFWLFSAMTLWGISGLWMSRISSREEFYAARFLLGMAEAGLAPAMTWYIAQWTPPWARARAMAGVLIAVPLSMVAGGPLCGWLLGLGDIFGLMPWRSMFLILAFPNFVLAVLAGFYFVDHPAQAHWLNERERQWLAQELSAETEATTAAASMRELLREPWLWRCATTWFLLMTGSYALVYWLPQLVRQLAANNSEFVIASISAFPLAGLALGLVLNSKHSDRSGERLLHVGLASAGGGLALFIAAWLGTGWAVLLLLFAAGFGIGAAQGVFWAIPGSVKLGGLQTPVEAIALISMFGTAGGIVGPWLIGFMLNRTGSFGMAIAILAALLVLALFTIAYDQFGNSKSNLNNTGTKHLP